jgi:hypothetical protein
MAVDLAQEQMEFTKTWNQLVARSLTDAAFKQRLLTEPSTVLTEHGVDLPADVEVRVHEGPWATVNLTVPASPDYELTDSELDFISGGAPVTCSATCCTTYTQACSCDISKCWR